MHVILDSMTDMLGKLTKASLFSLPATIFAFLFGEINETLITLVTSLVFLMVLDYVVQLWVNKKKYLSPAGVKELAVKFATYSIAIMVANRLGVMLELEPYKLEKLAQGWRVFVFFTFAIVEAKDILKGLQKKNGTVALKRILDKVEELDQFVDKKFDLVDDEDENKKGDDTNGKDDSSSN